MAVSLTNLNTELLARKAVSPQRDPEGTIEKLWAGADGQLISDSYIQALVADGRVFHARVGLDTTPATLDAAWANTDPDISMDIRAGITVIPLRVTVIFEAFGTDALAETMTLVSQTLGASSAGTIFTSLNMRTRHTRGSAVTVHVGPTVTSGYTGDHFELTRGTHQLVGTMAAGEAGPDSKFEWTYKQEGWAPLIEGDASMQTWAVSQAATGYIQWVWAEIPTLPAP